MVWACKYKDKYDSYWFVFNTESDALTWACSGIQYTIENDWDMTSLSQAAFARYINDLFIAKQYRDVLNYWNTICPTNISGQNPTRYEVGSYATLPGMIITPWDPSFFKALNTPAVAQTTSPIIPAPQFQATTSGATCRKCQTTNEYAYADNPDGTYECYGCRSGA